MFLDSEVMKKIIYTNENLKSSWLVLRCVCACFCFIPSSKNCMSFFYVLE